MAATTVAGTVVVETTGAGTAATEAGTAADGVTTGARSVAGTVVEECSTNRRGGGAFGGVTARVRGALLMEVGRPPSKVGAAIVMLVDGTEAVGILTGGFVGKDVVAPFAVDTAATTGLLEAVAELDDEIDDVDDGFAVVYATL